MIDDLNDDIDALIDELNASTGAARTAPYAVRVETMLAEVVRRRGSDLLLVAGSPPAATDSRGKEYSMIASTLGSYPRIGDGAERQRLRRSIQKFQTGELSRDELRRVEDQVVREVIDEQAGSGVDGLTDGLVRWEDGQT